MHRRAVSRLSRRVGFAPSPGPARTLQTSASYLNSESGDHGDGNSSGATKSPPKFGNRWASRNVSKAPGLSAAEIAMRQTLVANTPPPPPKPEPTSEKEPRPKPRNSFNEDSGKNTDRVSSNQPERASETPGDSRESDLPKATGRWAWASRQAPKPSTLSAAEQAMRDSMVAQSTSASSSLPERSERRRTSSDRIPGTPPLASDDRRRPSRRGVARQTNYESENDRQWKTDWKCPRCGAIVFSRRHVCPSCGYRRRRTDEKIANDDKPITRFVRLSADSYPTEESRTAAKLGELSRSLLHETEDVTPPPEHDPRVDTTPVKAKADDSWKKNQWSWDISALDQLKVEEDGEASAAQRRDKRKQAQQSRGDEDDDHDAEEYARRREEKKRLKQQQKKEAESAPSPLYLPEFISVGNLADVIGVRPGQFIARMEEMGFEEVEYNHVLDAETAGLVAAEFNYEAIFDTGAEDMQAAPVPEDTSHLPTRPPVVTIMGHVDHGKTTILDWLRKSSIAAAEHGGITQHIGAFSVAMPSGKTITFLDTPGHSAFLEMRRRGADVTDIVVLVVAADDSVKPQTIEAIKHATQANVPIIVAISKVDKEGSNPDRVKADLSANGVHVEDYGGEVQAIPVSGKTGAGMIELEEAIGALSEMLDHRADTSGNAEGWVLEASTKAYGRVASALIRRGTLRPGDVIVAGTTWARVRTLRNEAGVAVQEATPGMPVEIDGWREQPAAGTEILQADTEQMAKDVVDYRLELTETQKMGEDMAALNDARKAAADKRKLQDADHDGASDDTEHLSGPKAVNFIIKADVDGSAEALLNSMATIGNNEVYANVLRYGVGPVSEFDIEHAATAKGNVISFNMPIESAMGRLAEQEGVEIMDHNIIYKLIDDVKERLSAQLPPNIIKRVTGEAEIQQLFEITIKGRQKMTIAGCRVRNGMVQKSRKVRVLRGDKTVYDGAMTSLKNVKKDVTEMRKDTECGISFEEWSDFAVGDQVQCYEEIHEKRYL